MLVDNEVKWRKNLTRLFKTGSGHQPDYVFISLLGIILLLGLAFLASASSVVSYDKYGDAYFIFKQQFFKGVVFGLIAFYITSRVNFNFYKKISFFLLIFSLLGMVLVLIPGIGVNYLGGQRWISLPGFSFQPSEFLKFSLIIYFSALFSSRYKNIKSFNEVFLPFLIIILIVSGLIMMQPDMGTTIITIMICVTIYFLAGGNIIYLFGLGSVGIVGFWFLIQSASYRLKRLMVFLHPELDPQGIGYHINQALLAIGSGGIFGRGFGHSRQKFNYLPEVASDSIFAIIAEEWGFIFTLLFLLLFVYFFYRGFQIASKAPDKFSKFLVSGIMAWVVWQFLLNIMAMVELIPLTGAPLPFISHGSSSLLILLAAMGVIANVSRYTVKSR